MITSVSPCANVFDETLHAVNYSALRVCRGVQRRQQPKMEQETQVRKELRVEMRKQLVPIESGLRRLEEKMNLMFTQINQSDYLV